MIENKSIVIKQQIHKICSINIILRCNEICYHSYYLKPMKTQIYSPTFKRKDIFHNNVQEMIYTCTCISDLCMIYVHCIFHNSKQKSEELDENKTDNKKRNKMINEIK